MKELIGVLITILDERRHELAIVVVSLICFAAVWQMLIVWTTGSI